MNQVGNVHISNYKDKDKYMILLTQQSLRVQFFFKYSVIYANSWMAAFTVLLYRMSKFQTAYYYPDLKYLVAIW
jgi:hypothetical protein